MIRQGHPEHRFMTFNPRWVSDGTVRRPLNRFHHRGLRHGGLQAITLLTGAAAQAHAKQQCERQEPNHSAGGTSGRIVVVCVRTSRPMPKLKTRKAAAKRFKATGTGKFLRRRAFRNHLLDHKTPKQKRHLATKAVVDRTDEERVTLMMPYA
jgi:large subunit ribosomal protein L35